MNLLALHHLGLMEVSQAQQVNDNNTNALWDLDCNNPMVRMGRHLGTPSKSHITSIIWAAVIWQ